MSWIRGSGAVAVAFSTAFGVVLLLSAAGRLYEPAEEEAWRLIVRDVLWIDNVNDRWLRISAVAWSGLELAIGLLCFVSSARRMAVLSGASLVIFATIALGVYSDWGAMSVERCGCGFAPFSSVVNGVFPQALLRNGVLLWVAGVALAPCAGWKDRAV